jgi:ribonuclease BN (tRNA processing enzyme)
VLVSHLHGDHFGGLPFLILDGQFTHRTRPCTSPAQPGWASGWRRRWRCCFPALPGCGDTSRSSSMNSPTGSRSVSAASVLGW